MAALQSKDSINPAAAYLSATSASTEATAQTESRTPMLSTRTLLKDQSGVELWEVTLPIGPGVIATDYEGVSKRTPHTFSDARLSQAEAWFEQEVVRSAAGSR